MVLGVENESLPRSSADLDQGLRESARRSSAAREFGVDGEDVVEGESCGSSAEKSSEAGSRLNERSRTDLSVRFYV